MPHVPHVRYAAVTRYVELCQQLDLDAAALLQEHGLDIAGFSRQDTWIPVDSVARLLETSAARSGHDDFGVRLAELRRLSSIGPLSMVLREEATVRGALDLLRRYERSFNEALQITTAERDGLVTIRVTLDTGETEARQALELALGATYGLLRELLGESWRAAAVHLPHPAPADLEVHQRILGDRLSFEQEHAAVVLDSADLDRDLPEADPQRRMYAEEFLRGLGPRDGTVASQARAAIEVLMPVGRCSADTVAAELGVDRRTLHRHLAAEGETFSSVLDAVRTDLAERFLRTGRHSITEVSEILGFGAPSGLSRWFRHRYGCSPSQWRTATGT